MQPDTEKNQKALTFWQNKKKTYKSNLTVPIERESCPPKFPGKKPPPTTTAQHQACM